VLRIGAETETEANRKKTPKNKQTLVQKMAQAVTISVGDSDECEPANALASRVCRSFNLESKLKTPTITPSALSPSVYNIQEPLK
jgi:hypothetical protein